MKFLLGQIDREENNLIFSCPRKCIRCNFENAMELGFKCPDCESVLDKEDTTKKINLVRKELSVLGELVNRLKVIEIPPEPPKEVKKKTTKKKVVKKKVVKKKVVKKKVVKKTTKKKVVKKKVVKKVTKKKVVKKVVKKNVVKKKTVSKKPAKKSFVGRLKKAIKRK